MNYLLLIVCCFVLFCLRDFLGQILGNDAYGLQSLEYTQFLAASWTMVFNIFASVDTKWNKTTATNQPNHAKGPGH